MIHFQPVSQDNFDALIDLSVHEDQRGFMENNLYSIAQASVKKNFNCRGIFKEDQAIGFMVYYFVEGDPDYVYLHRFMIDKNYQGQGLGRQALEKALAYFKQVFPSIACVELMYYPDNTAGAALYKTLGFEPTGELRESSPCRHEKGTQDPNRYVEKVQRFYY
ncbi:MAG: GNAT family N-acetyltransferase [Tissierellia bacterium]|nr:GNAT family N-acetyltransferase [Tissierellia bacterium]